MICQIKRDPNTDEILEVLDPFGRTSKVFDQYIEYFSKRIDDPIIAKEEAAKSYILSNSAEGTVEFMSNPPSKRLLPVLKETGNEFLQLENKKSLLNLVNILKENVILKLKYWNNETNRNSILKNIKLLNDILKRIELLKVDLDNQYEKTSIPVAFSNDDVKSDTIDPHGPIYIYVKLKGEWTNVGWDWSKDLKSQYEYLLDNRVLKVLQKGGWDSLDTKQIKEDLESEERRLLLYPTYEDQYQITLDYIKKHFLNLGYDVMDVQQIAELYISSFVTQTSEPSLFYYTLAAVTSDEQVQNFIYNNLPLYDDFTKLLSVINDHYELSEVVDPSRYNYVKKEGKMTIFNKEYDPIIETMDKEVINSILHPLLFSIYNLNRNTEENQNEIYSILDDLINDKSLIESIFNLLTSNDENNILLGLLQLLNTKIYSEAFEEYITNFNPFDIWNEIDVLYYLLDNRHQPLPFKLQPQVAPEESRIKIDKAKENIRAILGDAVEVSTDIETVMDNMKVSGVPFGLFFNNLIYLNEKAAEQGTEYHEAFHAVFRMFLNDKEIDLYLNEARKEMNLSEEELNNRIDKLRDSVSNYSSLSRQQLEELVYEEYLADKYQEFTKTNKPSTKNLSIVSLFNRLMNAFLKLIGVRSKVEALFYDINNQRFKNKTLTPNRFVRQMKQVPAFQLIILDNNGLDDNKKPVIKYAKEHETDKIISDIAALVYREIKLQTRLQEEGELESIDSIFNRVMQERYDFYDPSSLENKEIIKNPNLTKEEQMNKLNQLKSIRNVFNPDLEKNKHNIDVIREGVQDKFKLFSFNPFTDSDYTDTDTADNREMLDISNVEIGGYNIVDNELREFMSLIIYEDIDEYTGRTILKSVDGSVVYNGLIKSMASSELNDEDTFTDKNKFMDTFAKYVQYGNEMSKSVFNELKTVSGYGTENFDPEHQLINLFKKTFDKEVMTYLQLLIDSTTKAFIIMDANRTDVDKLQLMEWQANWSNNEMDILLSDDTKRKELQTQFKYMTNKIFKDSVDLINKVKSPDEYQEKFESLLSDIFYGFTVNTGKEIITVPGFEKLTGMTLSKGYLSFSILNYIYTENKSAFESVVSPIDKEFFFNFKDIIMKTNDNSEETKIEALNPDTLGKIASIMFRSDADIKSLQSKYIYRAQELDELNRDSSKYTQINNDEYRNIYIEFPSLSEVEDNITILFTHDVVGFLKKIANTNAIFDESVVETSFQDANQNQRYSYVMKSYQTVATRRLRNPKYRARLMEKYKEVMKGNFLFSGPDIITNEIFGRDFKFTHTGDVRQTFVKLRDAEGRIVEYAPDTSEVQEGKGVTSKNIDAKTSNILLLSLFAHRKYKKFRDPDTGEEYVREFAYYNPKIFETKSTDQAILLPVGDIEKAESFYDSEKGITNIALDRLYDMFDSELGLIDKIDRELQEGIKSLREFNERQLKADETLQLQLQLAKLRNKEYNTEGLTEEETLAVEQERINDLSEINRLEGLINSEYTGPLLYEGFHIVTDGKGNIEGLGRGFDLWNFAPILKDSPLVDNYIKARKTIAQLNLLNRVLTKQEEEAKKAASLTIDQFNKNKANVKKEVKNAIKKMLDKDLNNYYQRLLKYKILAKDGKGNIENLLVPFNEESNPGYKDVNHFIGDFFINGFINNMSYNLIIDKDPRIRKDSVDAVKRNAGSLAFGANLGSGEFTVAFRQGQKDKYEIVTGNKETIERDDAQAHMTVDRFIFVLTRLGKVSESLKPIFNKIRFGDNLTWDEKEQLDNLGATFNSVKGVYFDGENYQKLSYAILVRNMTSILPGENKARAKEIRAKIEALESSVNYKRKDKDTLTKVKYLWDEYETLWVAHKNRQILHNLRVNMQLNGIDEVLPPSASKLLTPIVATQVNDTHDFSYNVSKRKNEFWRLQVETPSGKTKITFPSQLLQIIDNEQNKLVAAAIRDKVYDVKEVVKKYRKGLTDRVRNSMEQALNSLGEYKDGKFNRDVVKFQKKIRETLLNSGSDEVLLDFFRDLSPDGKSSKYNFNIPAIRTKFEQLFLAHFSKNVLQQVVPGRKSSLISDWGLEVVVDSNDNVISELEIKSNFDKYYEKDVNDEYNLKPEYKVRRLKWSQKGEIQGIRLGDKLITDKDIDPELFKTAISYINDKDKIDLESYDQFMQLILGVNPTLLKSYLDLKRSALISKTTGRPIKPKYVIKIDKVISGLQTGIDTIGLRIAKEKGLKTGGTTTSNFGTEKGGSNKELAKEFGVKAISKELQEKYEAENPTAEAGSNYYNARTEQNVLDADVTIYFATDTDSAGLKSTERFANKHNKPFLLYGKDFKNDDELRELLSKIPHKTINIAGNRESALELDQDFKDEVENILGYLFSPYYELDENDSDVTVDFNQLKAKTGVVRQANYSEAIMPVWFRDLYNLKSGDLLTYESFEEFKKINEKLTEEDFKAHNINRKALDSIFKMFGTRIPTEDKRSMVALKVVDFLPIEMGDVIVLPLETVFFSGEDFDIDSKYLLRKEFYTSKTADGKKIFNVYGEYNIDDLKSIYNEDDYKPTVKEREFTPDEITKDTLPPNGIFVFGSNTLGVHGLGAAKTARLNFGAQLHNPRGLQGKSFAVRTKMYVGADLLKYNELSDEDKKRMDEMTAEDLEDLRVAAIDNPDLKFYVTEIGTKNAGRTLEEMRNFFQQMNDKYGIPNNIILPESFEMRSPTFFTESSEQRLINQHLWEEYLKHNASFNKDVILDLELAKETYIQESQNGVDVFAENDLKMKEFKKELTRLKEEAKPLRKSIKELEKQEAEAYEEYKKLKDEFQEVKDVFDIQSEIDKLPNDSSKEFLSNANNILKKFTVQQRKRLGELLQEEYEIQSSEDYKEYLRKQEPNDTEFDEYMSILNKLSNTSKIGTTRDELETFVKRFEEGTAERLEAEETINKISDVKAKAAVLKAEYSSVKQLKKVVDEINSILNSKDDNDNFRFNVITDDSGKTLTLSPSNRSHNNLKKKLYREAKVTINSFRHSINHNQRVQDAIEMANNKNERFSKLEELRDGKNELIERIKPINKQIADTKLQIDEQRKVVSYLKYEVLKVALRLNKLPSTFEEFVGHPNYKRLNNSSINNELLDMISLMYLNEAMDDIRYAESSLETFHGDGKKNTLNIGLSNIMLNLTGRQIDKYLYNTIEGIMQAKEANKLGAELIGPVAITNIVKSTLARTGRSGVKLRVPSITYDGKSYTNLGVYEAEDIEFEVSRDQDQNISSIVIKTDDEGKIQLSKGKRVMSELSYLLAAMTDNAKHGDAFKLNLTLDSLSVYTYMISLGMGTNRAILLANQPALFEYNALNAAKKSAIMSNEDIDDADSSNEIFNITKKYTEIADKLRDYILGLIEKNPELDKIEYNNKDYSFGGFSKMQKDMFESKEERKDLSLRSNEMFKSMEVFKNLGIDYVNSTAVDIINHAKEFTNAETLKELYKAIVEQVHVIKAFDRLQRQSKEFIRINSLLRLNQGLPSSFYELQNIWDTIDMFKIDTEALLNGQSKYTLVTESQDIIYDIQQVLDDNEDIKQMLIHFLRINDVSKEFVISQTDYFDRIFKKITAGLRTGITDRANTLKQIKEDFLSYLSLNAYKNMFLKRGEKVPFGPELLYTDLIDPNDPKGTSSRTLVQQLNDLLEDPKNVSLKRNIFIKTIRKEAKKIAKKDINILNDNPYALAIRLDLITADSRKKIDSQTRKRIVNGFRELMVSTNPKVRQFADNLFYYLIVKDGLQFKNSSFIKYIPAEMYQDYSDVLDKINNALRNNVWESTLDMEGIEDLVGMGKKEIEDSFVSLFARDPKNRDLFTRVEFNKFKKAQFEVEKLLDDSTVKVIKFNGKESDFFSNDNRDFLDIDVSKIIDYSQSEAQVLEENSDDLPILNYAYKNNMWAQINDKQFFKTFNNELENNGDEYIKDVVGYVNYNEFIDKLKIEKKKLKDKTVKLIKSERTEITEQITKNTPFKAVKDQNGLVVALNFPLFFTMKLPAETFINENDTGVFDENEDQDDYYPSDKYEVYVLSNYVPYQGEADEDGVYYEDEAENKFKYKSLKARYVKMSQINTSMYNYLYSPQEYKHLMLRLLEVQKQLNEGAKAEAGAMYINAKKQKDAIAELMKLLSYSSDNFTYNLTQEETPPVFGGALSKVVRDLNTKDSKNVFTESEERVLSRRLFGESKYKRIHNSTISKSLLSDKDKAHLDSNMLIKTVNDNAVISRLKLNMGETALVKIDNIVYKVTNRGIINPYDLITNLNLDRDSIVSELLPYISDIEELKPWLGYNVTDNNYYPFDGKSSRIYQIEKYYESKLGKEISNDRRAHYGVTEVITAFNKESKLRVGNGALEVTDNGGIDSISKFNDLYTSTSPHITVIFDDGSDYIKSVINYINNGNISIESERRTNVSKGLFVIDVKNINEGIVKIKDFLIDNNIPGAKNKLMIVKSPDDNTNYNNDINIALTNPDHLIGLSKNLSKNKDKYPLVLHIVSTLRSLGYAHTLQDILSKGYIDILPSSLVANTEDGKVLYNFIMTNHEGIQKEINDYRIASAVLSEETRRDLAVKAKKAAIKVILPHNMVHEPRKSESQFYSKEMRPELVAKGITTTYDAFINGDRSQSSRQYKDIKNAKVGDVIGISAKGRPTVYARVTAKSDKSVSELLLEDFKRLGFKSTLKDLDYNDVVNSDYVKEWSRKQGWSIDYMFYNINSLKDKYDIDFELIPDVNEYFKETGIIIEPSTFGWTISNNNIYDRLKASNSNAYIGYTDTKSRKTYTNSYITNAVNQNIPFNDNLVPDENTVAFVSVPGNETMTDVVKKKILDKAIEVLEAGGTLLMNDLIYATTNNYSKSGEGVILKELYDRFNNLEATNVLSYKYVKYSLENLQKKLEEDGQKDPNCK